MTREHVPPRSVGNDRPVALDSDLFDQDAVVADVAQWDDGHVVQTLCTSCNHRASRWGYVAEYRRWHDTFVDLAKAAVAQHGLDPLRGANAFEVSLPYDVQPARFVRQAIGMLLAVQATEHLFASNPVLSELVGPDPADDAKRRHEGVDLSPMHLYLSVCNARWCYLRQPGVSVELSLVRERGLWTPPGTRGRSDELVLLGVAPFFFVLTTRADSTLGLDVTSWTAADVNSRPTRSERSLQIPTVDQLVGWLRGMVYPADYVERDS